MKEDRRSFLSTSRALRTQSIEVVVTSVTHLILLRAANHRMNSPLLRSHCRHFTIINSSFTPLASLVALIASMNFELLAPSARLAPLQAIAHDLPSSDMQAVAWHGGTRRRARDTSAGTCTEDGNKLPRIYASLLSSLPLCLFANGCRHGMGDTQLRRMLLRSVW